jgi:hypothetical protein
MHKKQLSFSISAAVSGRANDYHYLGTLPCLNAVVFSRAPFILEHISQHKRFRGAALDDTETQMSHRQY